MFIIQKLDDGYYIHHKGKIILFESPQEAEMFLQNFHQYSLQRLLQEKGAQGFFEVENTFSKLQIIEKVFEEIPPCGVVSFHEIVK